MNRKETYLFILAFAILLIGRLSIAGTGYLEDQDEFLYIWIHLHHASFIHLTTWVDCMTNMRAQPPEIALRFFEYLTVLPLAILEGRQPLHPDILSFIGLYNILISLLILFVFFRILLKLGFSFILSLSGVFLLGTLFNYNMYTRHILPYDHALLFQLLALNLLLSPKAGPAAIFFAGLLSAIGLTNYFGCFMFIFINAGFIVFDNYKRPIAAVKKSLLFIAPFLLLLLCYEAIARICGQSYLHYSTFYYHTVGKEGSFDEGLTFLFIYFFLVEKAWGICLLLIFFLGSYLVFKEALFSKTKQLILLAVIAYMAYGCYVMIFHRMVFEGRVLHIYYPFIIIGVLAWMARQKLWPDRHIALVSVFFACLNYGFEIQDFRNIGYPRNAIYKWQLFEHPGTQFSYYREIPTPVQYDKRADFCIDSTGSSALPGGHYLLSNICFFPTTRDSLFTSYKPIDIASSGQVIFEQLDFQSHPAYTLEYCTRRGREFFLEKKFKIRVVKL